MSDPLSVTSRSGAGPNLRDARRKVSSNGHIDRLPPHSIEAEQGVLGCCLLDPKKCIPQCVERFAGEKPFYDLRHETIYDAIIAVDQSRRTPDLITVQQHLKDAQMLDAVGGLSYLMKLPDCVPIAENVGYYLDIVCEKHILRKLVLTCTELVGSIYDFEGDVESFLSEAERAILAVRPKHRAAGVTVKELVVKAIDEIEASFSRQGAISGISTGLADLDKLTDGLHPGDYTVIAAPPSLGKSSLAMNIAEHAMLVEKKHVGIFSLEMTAVQLVKRTICSHARVNLRNIRDGFLSERDFPKLTSAAGKISVASIWFDDTSDLSIYELRARARRLHQEHRIDLWIVDYIQLLNARGGPRKIENRAQEVADISVGLKNMAKEFSAPVLALSQVNDDGKVKESRGIGQDADGLWKLFLPKGCKAEGEAYPVDLFIEKQRNGPRGETVALTFLASYTRFESASKVSDEDVPRGRRHNDE